MAIGDYFDTLTDADFAMDAGTVLAAYMAADVAGPVVEGFAPIDLPNESYGILTIVAAEAAMSGSRKVLVQYGGAVHTLESVSERFGVTDAIENVGGN